VAVNKMLLPTVDTSLDKGQVTLHNYSPSSADIDFHIRNAIRFLLLRS